MDLKSDSSGSGKGFDVSDGSGKRGQKTVSLQDFVTSHWQMLTIFGVFAGFTNYLSNTENSALIALGFLLTFMVELEILQLLLRIKNKSPILKAFTLLSIVFILFFAAFIYSNLVSDTLSSFGMTIYPLIIENRVWVVGTILLISILVVAISLYRQAHSLTAATLRLLARVDRRILARLPIIIMILAALIVFTALLWFNRAPESGPTATMSTTLSAVVCLPPSLVIGGECCFDFNNNSVCDEVEGSTTTSTIQMTTSMRPSIACLMNSDCGNQSQRMICYRGNVYVQQVTPLCQMPGTLEARCVLKSSLLGETITQEAIPVEKCLKGCKDGKCI